MVREWLTIWCDQVWLRQLGVTMHRWSMTSTVTTSPWPPSDRLFRHAYREFRRKCIFVVPRMRMKSAAQSAAVMRPQERGRLAGEAGATLGQGAEPGNGLARAPQAIMATNNTANVWALAGIHERGSKAPEGTTVMGGDLSEGMAHLALCMNKAMEHPGPARGTVAWLIERDRQTRTRARSLCLGQRA